MSAVGALADRVVAGAMVTMPKTLVPDASIATARDVLEDPHVHMVLLTHGRLLVGTIVRNDLSADRPGWAPALDIATLAGRTVPPSAPVAQVRDRMISGGLRRLAVVDDDHRLLGLLCLKRDRSGFCSDHGVRARAVAAGSCFTTSV